MKLETNQKEIKFMKLNPLNSSYKPAGLACVTMKFKEDKRFKFCSKIRNVKMNQSPLVVVTNPIDLPVSAAHCAIECVCVFLSNAALQ